ncbi:DEAD/DEAH box helicase [Paenibacillus sp. ACRRX]|uniref:DEAD/DEAH box helicase n=1 Tax=Paenibacillus sp. ACRRX TaxID=2918206 RepID=UPI001EF623AF|nr:DEAD/DEAH box helicase [Paenibacillus sp. ACRRX]MCG7408162.1 DEAD/DEAH box helicase [Paenibacillus sp. ACRRX]
MTQNKGSHIPTFKKCGINDDWIQALSVQGITQPTAIQGQTIPDVLLGTDVIGQAKTGTGKTLAFLLPMLQRLDRQSEAVQGLIVAPTRELALQITAEANKLAAAYASKSKETPIPVLAVYGGQDVERQMRKLKGNVQIVIATPGRLLDHLRRGTIELSHLKTLVLDEADQMLHMGFLDEVEQVIAQTPVDRQTLLFSATLTDEVRALASRYTRSAKDVRVESERITVQGIEQWVLETTDRTKQSTLRGLLKELNPYLAIVFCRTKIRAKALNEALQQYGFISDELHGDLSQTKREQVMRTFRDAKLHILVATDVAARGIDVDGVTHVFNYDMPLDTEGYVHRIGRTGRAGNKGVAITMAAAKDGGLLRAIEKGLGHAIPRWQQSGVSSKPERISEGRSSSKQSGPRSAQSERGQSRRSSDARTERDGAGRSGRAASSSRRSDRSASERFGNSAPRGKGGRQADQDKSRRTGTSTEQGRKAERGFDAAAKGQGSRNKKSDRGSFSRSASTRDNGAAATRSGKQGGRGSQSAKSALSSKRGTQRQPSGSSRRSR